MESKNREILDLIREKFPHAVNIRHIKSYPEIQIPCTYQESEISWLALFQMSQEVEKLVESWLKSGGKIINESITVYTH